MDSKLDPNLEIKKIRLNTDMVDVKNNYYGVIPNNLQRLVIAGSTMSGKTNLLSNLLTKKHLLKNYYHSIFILTPTSDPKYEYIRRRNKEVYILEWDIETLNNVREKIIDLASEMTDSGSPALRTLFILDDYIDQKEIANSEFLRWLSIKSRHYNVTLWVLSQHYKFLTVSVRNNSQFFIIFNQSRDTADVIANDLSAGKMTRVMLRDIIVELPQFQFVVINKSLPVSKRYSIGFQQKIEFL